MAVQQVDPSMALVETKETDRSSGSDVDHVLPLVGEFGRYQILLVACLCVAFVPLILPVLITFFVAHNPGWRCAENSTACTLNGTFFPSDDDYNYRCDIGRSDWEFPLPKDYSIVTQFELVCAREGLALLTTSIYFVGSGFGAIIIGSLADRFGRKTVLFPSLFAVMTVTCISSFSPNVYMFMVARFIVGFSTTGCVVQVYVFANELVGHKYRPLSGSVLWISFSLSLGLLGVKAYFVREWKVLQLICTLPYYFIFLSYKFVPESIRWQRVNGKLKEAEATLLKVAKFNKKNVSSIILSEIEQDDNIPKGSIKDALWPPKMLLRTAPASFTWFVCGMVYYGVTLASDDLGGSMYRDYILSSLVEIPAVFVAIYLCNRYGRKIGCNPMLYFTSFVLISIAMVPKSSGVMTIRVFFGVIGKFCISVAFAAIYTWSVELYPTSIRSAAMGCFQITSRAGAASAPWVAHWLRNYKPWLPFAVMGIFSLVGGVAMHWHPETRNKPTLETLQDLLSTDSASDVQLEEEGKLLKEFNANEEKAENV